MKLNHIGIVVRDIETEAAFYKELGFSASELIINESQNVKEIFVSQNSNVTIELLEPLNKTSPVYNFLNNKGGGVHHLCYEINEDIDVFLTKQRKEGAVIICKPIYDIAFDNRIAFFYKQRKMIEVVEILQ